MSQPQTNHFEIKEKPPTKRILGYLFGIPPLTLYMGFFGYAYAKFFLDDLGLAKEYWYLALVIYAIINATNDPILGHMSDNTNVKKWGSRRLIYVKYGSPILALCFLAIWWIPTNHGSQFLLFLHFVITICMYDTFLTLVVMTWMALLPDMTMDTGERTKINFIGSIFIIIVGFPLLMVSTLDHETLKYVSLFIAGISIISYFFVVILSKEKPEFQHDKGLSLIDAVKFSLKSKSYLCFIGYNFMGSINSSMSAAFMFFYWAFIWKGSVLYYYLIVMIVGYGANILCMSLRKRYGMIKLIVTFGLIQILGGIASFFLLLNPATEQFIWISIIWSAFFGGAGVFKYILQMLPIDEDELKTGQRREGAFYGINALIAKPAESLGPIIGTAILFAFGYVQQLGPQLQVPSMVLGVKVLFFLVPQIFNLIGLWIVSKYPLNGKNLEEMQKQLEVLHHQKQEKIQTISKN